MPHFGLITPAHRSKTYLTNLYNNLQAEGIWKQKPNLPTEWQPLIAAMETGSGNSALQCSFPRIGMDCEYKEQVVDQAVSTLIHSKKHLLEQHITVHPGAGIGGKELWAPRTDIKHFQTERVTSLNLLVVLFSLVLRV